MRHSTRSSGFTLIELLVVIGILSILSAALYRGLGAGQETALQRIDKLTLQRKYGELLSARMSGARLPKGGGHEFVYYPWVSGAVQRTKGDLESMFVTDSFSPRLAELLEEDTRTVLTSYDEITSEDTDFAGRAAEHYQRDMFRNGHEALLATDNENGPTYANGAVHVLYGDGSVQTIMPSAGEVLEVGPGSSVAELRKLRN